MKDLLRQILLLASFLAAVTAGTQADPATTTRDALVTKIAESRQSADYVTALSLCRRLSDSLARDPEAKPWNLVDAENLLRTLELAASLSPEDRKALAEADGTTASIERFIEEGKYRDARPAAENQLEIRRRVLGNRHRETAETLENLAVILWKLNHFTAAESHARDALEILQEAVGPEHPDVAGCLNVLGLTVMASGRPREAEQLYEDALAMNRRLYGEEHISIATNLHNLGAVRHEQEDVRGAEPFYRAALAMFRKLLPEDDARIANTLHALGFNLASQGDLLGAERLYREALDIRLRFLGEDHPDAAFTMVNLAGVLARAGADRDPERAEDLGRKALPILRNAYGDVHLHVAWCQAVLLNLALHRHDLAEAERLARDRLEKTGKILGESGFAYLSALGTLGDVLVRQGRSEEAVEVFTRLQDGCRRTYGHDQAVACLKLGRLSFEQGRMEEAEAFLSRAAARYEVERLRATSNRTRLFSDWRSPYSTLAAVRLEMGMRDEAWPMEERRHGRILNDLLIASGRRSLSPADAERERSLKRALTELEGQMQALEEASRNDPTGEPARRLDETRTRLLEAQAEWGLFQEEIFREHPITEGGAYPLQRVQSSLAENSALVGWIDEEIDEDDILSWGYVIRSSGPVHWERLESRTDDGVPLTTRAEEFRERLTVAGSWLFHVSSDAATRDDGFVLWAERVAPLVPHLDGVDHLIVIPSGSMLGIPVEALMDDRGVSLGERYAVSYTPSATIYAWLEENSDRRAAAKRKGLLVGDPPFTEEHLATVEKEGSGLLAAAIGPMDEAVLRSALAGNKEALAKLPRLPRTRGEVARLGSVMPGSSVLLGEDATEQEIVRLAESGKLKEFDTFHFATHALIDDQRPDASALVLSRVGLPDPLEAVLAGTRTYDGLLTAREIVRELELDADLVTLSGCQTALGKETAGEGYIGLAHAFLQVGARSLVVSLWRVEDTATAILMGRFYENLTGTYEGERLGFAGQPMSKVNALREAKSWLRGYTNAEGEQPYGHPAYWSAFILIGCPD